VIFFSTVFFGGMFLVSQFQELLLLLHVSEDGEMARKLVGGAHEAHVL
jgi:hypothetical protein